MKIRKLTASFGKLEHESLSFHEGAQRHLRAQ